jgi:hypothetical protein
MSGILSKSQNEIVKNQNDEDMERLSKGRKSRKIPHMRSYVIRVCLESWMAYSEDDSRRGVSYFSPESLVSGNLLSHFR